MDGLRLEIKSKLTDSWMEVYLEDDAEISMEVNSPLWNKTSTYSYPFSIPCAPNRHILGNSDQISGTSVYDMLYHRPIRLFVQGLLWVQGIIDMDKEIELEDGEIEINIVSGRKTLDETLEGVSLRDIDVESRRIQIGYCNNVKNGVVNDPNSPADGATVDVHVQIGVNYFLSARRSDSINHLDSPYLMLTWGDKKVSAENFTWFTIYDWTGSDGAYSGPLTVNGGTGVFNALQQMWPKLDAELYHKHGGINLSLPDCTNISAGYDGQHMFCNIPVCWQRYVETGDGSWQQTRGYQDTKAHGDPGAPDRAGSAPCFFALAVVDMLFQDLDIPIVENALREIDDINRLALIHTDWHGTFRGDDRIIDNDGNYVTTIFPRQDGLFDDNLFGFKMPNGYRPTEEKPYIRKGMLELLAEKSFVCGPLKALTKADLKHIEDVAGSDNFNKYQPTYNFAKDSDPQFSIPRLTMDQIKEIAKDIPSIAAADDPRVDKYGVFHGDGNADDDYSGGRDKYCHFVFEGVALRLTAKDGYQAKLNDPYVYRCYATSENLPDADAKSLIDGLETMFGARFMYDDVTGRCRIVLLREVLSQQEVIDLKVADYSEYKVENHVRGFRLKYGKSQHFEATALKKEEDITTGDDETAYNYNDWDKVRMMNYDLKSGATSGNQGTDSASYGAYGRLICNISCFDETCYVDYLTGNAYRIKVDKDAEVVDSSMNPDKVGLNPSLVEVGAFMAAEIGDCSDNELVEEVTIGLDPVTANDMHYEDEKAYYGSGSTFYIGAKSQDDQIQPEAETGTSPNPKYSVFCNAEVHQGRTSVVSYDYNVGTMTGETYKITKKVKEEGNGKEVERDIVKTRSVSLPVTLTETYPNMAIGWDLSQGFDSPLQKCSFDMTVGVLRTGGSDGNDLIVVEKDYDGLGHDSWTRASAGEGQVTSDSIDTYGNIIGDAKTKPLSLKIIAKKKNPYHGASPENKKFKMSYDPYKDICDEDGYFLTEPNASQRGLYYDYYFEYAYWVINRKIVRITIPANHISLSQLCNIDMTRKYKIGIRIGFINKVSYRITNNGISNVEIELYYL